MVMMANDLKFLTSEWLSNTLIQAGHDIGRVIDFKQTMENRYVTSIHHLDLTFENQTLNPSLNHLFLKVYKSNLYHDISNSKEVEFYNFFPANMPAGACSIGFPPCISAGFIDEAHVAYVLLYDLSKTHYSLIKSHQCPQDELEQLITVLAKFHAFWWDHPKLGHGIQPYVTREDFVEYIGDLERRLPVFFDIMGDKLPPERQKIYQKIIDNGENLFQRLAQKKNVTMIHGDANPIGNILFPFNRKDPAYLIDWNAWRVHLGTKDVAYAIGLNFYPHQRARFESNILKLYYNLLVENGVTNYDWDEFWYDYRLCMVVNLMAPMVLSTWDINLGVWWPYYFKGFLNFEDLKCEELLPL